MTENDIMTLFKGLYSRDNARKLIGALRFVLPPKRDGSVFINKYEGQVLRTVSFTMPTSLINKFKELVIKTIDKVNKGIGFPLYQCDFISKNEGINTSISLAVKMTPVTQEVLDFLHIDDPLESVTDILSNNQFLLDFKYPSEYRIVNSDKTGSVIKKLLEAGLLYPGYEKDLEFLKPASKLFATDIYKNKLVFDNYLEDLSDIDKTHRATNWYVLLQFIPGIIGKRVKNRLFVWFKNWPIISHSLDKTIIEFKIPEFMEPGSGNQEVLPNIKWS